MRPLVAGIVAALAVCLPGTIRAAGTCSGVPTIVVTDTTWENSRLGVGVWTNAVLQGITGSGAGQCVQGDTFWDSTFCGTCSGQAGAGCVEARFNLFAHNLCATAVSPGIGPAVQPIWDAANQNLGCVAAPVNNNQAVTLGFPNSGFPAFAVCCEVYDFRKTFTIAPCGVACAEIEVSADDYFAIRLDNSNGNNQVIQMALNGAGSGVGTCVRTFNLTAALRPGANTIHLIAEDTTGPWGGPPSCGTARACSSGVGARWVAARLAYCENTCSPTATGTDTRTATSTPSPSPTITESHTPTDTPLLSSTVTNTTTPVPTDTTTETFSITATLSPTITRTPTFTWTPTISWTPTVSSTPSITSIATPTFTLTPNRCAGVGAPFLMLDRNVVAGPDGLLVCWAVSDDAAGVVRIFNSAGELVKNLWAGSMNTGIVYSERWDATNDLGKPAASGIYIVRMDAVRYHFADRVAVVR